MSKEVPQEIRKQLTRWGQQATLYRYANAILGAAAVVASVLVAAKINSFQKATIEWVAVVAASTSGLLTSLDMGPKANRMRNAWRRLNTAVILYESEGSQMTIEQLVKEYSEAESLIGDTTIVLKT